MCSIRLYCSEFYILYTIFRIVYYSTLYTSQLGCYIKIWVYCTVSMQAVQCFWFRWVYINVQCSANRIPIRWIPKLNLQPNEVTLSVQGVNLLTVGKYRVSHITIQLQPKVIYTSVIIRDFWTVKFENTDLRFSAHSSLRCRHSASLSLLSQDPLLWHLSLYALILPNTLWTNLNWLLWMNWVITWPVTE